MDGSLSVAVVPYFLRRQWPVRDIVFVNVQYMSQQALYADLERRRDVKGEILR